MFYHKHPLAAAEWLKKTFTRTHLAELKEKSLQVIKPDYETIEIELEAEISRLSKKY